VLAKAVRQALAAWPGSLHTLAKACGLSAMHLSYLTRGVLPATPRAARKIARALGRHGGKLSRAAAGIAHQLENMQ